MNALREKFDQWVKTVATDRRCFFVDEAGSFYQEWSPIRSGSQWPTGPYSATPKPRHLPHHDRRPLGNGLAAMITIRGGTTANVFAASTAQFIASFLLPSNPVVLDNLLAHRDKRVRQAVESAGAKLIFTPPHSPEFNPIELDWN